MDVEIVESRVVELGAKGDCRKPLGLDGTPWGSDDGRVVEVQAPRMRRPFTLVEGPRRRNIDELYFDQSKFSRAW